GDRLLLRLAPGKTDQIEVLSKALQEIETVHRVSRMNNALELRVTSSEAVLPAVLTRVVDSGCHLEAVQYSRPSLGEVCVTYTGHGIMEDIASGESLMEAGHE